MGAQPVQACQAMQRPASHSGLHAAAPEEHRLFAARHSPQLQAIRRHTFTLNHMQQPAQLTPVGEERCTLKLADMEGGARVMAGRPVKEEKRPDTDWLLPCTMREAGALSAR